MFFLDMWILQKIRRSLVLLDLSKKSTYEWIRFLSKSQEPHIWVILGLLGPPDPTQHFSQKLGFVTFLPL